MIRKGGVKKIVVISSGMGDIEITRTGIANAVVYSTMKAAVNMVVAKFTAELKGEGIKLLALCPGVVDTQDLQNEDTKRTEQEEKDYQAEMDVLRQMAPAWPGPMTPAESVKKMMEVIENLGEENNGAFLSHHGDKNWL